MTERQAYLDNVKGLLTLGVIALHCSAAYGGPTTFIVHQAADSALAASVFAGVALLLQPFLLGCYFFIAGYFVPGAVRRYGAGQYVGRRLKQLGLPLLAYDLVGERTQAALITLADTHSFRAAATTWATSAFELGSGPLWFVERLLVFTLLWVGLWRLYGGLTLKVTPTPRKIAGLLGGLGLASFLIRVWLPFNLGLHLLTVDFPFLPLQYPVWFLLGIAAADSGWLARLDPRATARWLAVGLGSLPVFAGLYVLGGGLANPLLFAGGWCWQSLTAAVWEQVFGLALTLGVIGWCRNYAAAPGPRWLTAHTFGVYVWHQPVLVLAWLALRGWPSLAAFAVTLLLTVSLTWAGVAGVQTRRARLRTIREAP